MENICVLGGGTMGGGITQLLAQSGYKVSMRDIEDKFVERSLNGITGNLKKFFVDKGKMTQSDADTILARITGTTNLKEAVAEAQVVIESVPEQLALKQQMFRELDELCPPETILATNTSSLSVNLIGSVTKRQEKVIGMHFFNPATVMRLVEIIRGARTSDETYDIIKVLTAKLGKEAITVQKDTAGFIVNRIFLSIVNEAAKLVYEGIATPEDVDKGCQLGLGHTMGPLRTIDLTGIDIGLDVLQVLREGFGDAFLPCPLIKTKVAANQLGTKTGTGFYDYTQK
ncbi:3-hydroxyacyl-CoA dehydrogenase family protein [Chloroflexota bacterium]